ncbi:MAG: hypothetical protein ACJAS1_006801, partial [Oleiphilaceae bacterium]
YLPQDALNLINIHAISKSQSKKRHIENYKII